MKTYREGKMSKQKSWGVFYSVVCNDFLRSLKHSRKQKKKKSRRIRCFFCSLKFHVFRNMHTQCLTTTLIASWLSMVQGYQYLAVASLKSSTSEKSQECKCCVPHGASPFWEASLSHKVMVKRLLTVIQEREYLPQLKRRQQKVASTSYVNLITALIQQGRHSLTTLPLITLLFTQLRKDWLCQELCLLM